MACARARTALALAVFAAALAACTGTFNQLGGTAPVPTATERRPPPTIGTGQVRIGLILPLSAPGNAGVAAASMKNAAEMALAEFKEPNIQLLVKDDAGTPQGAQVAAQQALDEGAELIIGPLFAQSVSAVGSVARPRNIPVIAFSTDASVAARGVYLLSFLPESDVKRIVEYAVARGKRSFAALLPDNGYGAVVEAALQQEVARRGGRVLALEKYPLDPGRMTEAVKRIAQSANGVDSILHRRRRRRGAAGGAEPRRQRRQPQARAVARHRIVGRSAHLPDRAARRRLVCRAGIGRLPQLLRPLPRALRPRPGAHRDARL